MRCLAVFALLLAPVAFAQESDGVDDRDAPRIQYRAVTEIDIEAVDVNATIVRPSGGILMERKRAAFPSLVDLREDFAPELAASIDEVK